MKEETVRGVERGMMTRRRFSLLAASLPLSLAGLRNVDAQVPPEWEAWQKEQERLRAAWQEAMRVPIGAIARAEDRTLYGAGVHSIYRWADAGKVTYLATAFGVKRVSKEPKSVPRHYLPQDGLPLGRVVDLLADDKGAFALLDVAEGTEALYGLDLKTDRWKELARWQKSRREGYDGSSAPYEDGLLALGEDVVLATPRRVATRSESVLTCVGREDGLTRALPWDALIRADHAVLRIGSLSCGKRTLNLGTDIGLLEIPLSADGGGAWTRSLVTHSVLDARSGGGRLYLWLTARGPSGSSRGGRAHLYDPKSGALQPLSDPILFPQTGFAAAVDAEGALWIVRQQVVNGEDAFRNWSSLDSGDMEALFWRWRPGDSRWARLRPDGSEIPVAAVPVDPTNIPQRFGPDFTLPQVPAASVVPDAPARLAALNAFVGGWGAAFPDFFPGQPARPFHPMRWLKERFPHWLGLDDSESVPAALHGSPSMFAEAVASPKNPEAAWLGREPGFLASYPTTSLPGPPLPPAGEGQTPSGGRWLNPPKGAPLARVPLPARTFPLHVNARQVLTLAGDKTLVIGERAIFLVSGRGKRWERIALPQNPNFDGMPTLTSSDRAFAMGGEAYLAYWLERSLLRLDRKALAFVPTGISREGLYNFAGADESGAWWSNGANLSCLEPGATKARERKPKNAPEGFSLYNFAGMAEGRLWWIGNLAGKQALVGWSPKTETWSTPLPLEYLSGNLAAVGDGRGGVCVAVRPRYDAKEVNMHRWDAKTDRWSVVATVPSRTATTSENIRLLAVGDDGFWLAGDRVVRRFSQKAKATEEFPLPFVDPHSVYGMRRDIWATQDGIFELTDGGLYRFDRRRLVWEEWTRPVPSAEVRAQTLAADEKTIWGKIVASNAVVPPLFRFDPATRRFDFFDGASGLPEQTEGKLVAAGKSVWFLHGTGAFRFHEPSGKFVREAQFRAELLASTDDGETVWIAGYVPGQQGHPAVYRWERATGKIALEKPSEESGNICRALLASGRGVLLATLNGLFRSEKPDIWEPIDTLGLLPAALAHGADGSLWASDGANFLRIDARAGL